MHDMLEFFNLGDTIPLVLLIWLLEFVGKQMSEHNATVRWWARGFAAVGFLFYAGLGIDTWHPTRAAEFLALGVRALLAMGTVHGLACITLPVVCFLHEHLWAKPMAHQRAWMEKQACRAAADKARQEAAERQQAEDDRLAEEKRLTDEEIARRPPPPTREELMTAAKQRYEGSLRVLSAAGLDSIELQAAQEKVKQQYLRDLNEAMK